jgi:hypothetical protein
VLAALLAPLTGCCETCGSFLGPEDTEYLAHAELESPSSGRSFAADVRHALESIPMVCRPIDFPTVDVGGDSASWQCLTCSPSETSVNVEVAIGASLAVVEVEEVAGRCRPSAGFSTVRRQVSIALRRGFPSSKLTQEFPYARKHFPAWRSDRRRPTRDPMSRWS